MSKRLDGKNDRRKRLLDAAQASLREHGLSGLSMRNIGKRAGLSATAAYALIGSKRQIVQVLLNDFIVEQETDLFIHRPADIASKTLWIVEGHARAMRADPEYVRSLRMLLSTLDFGQSGTFDIVEIALWRELGKEIDDKKVLVDGLKSSAVLQSLQAALRGHTHSWAVGDITADEFERRCKLTFQWILFGATDGRIKVKSS